VIDGESHDHTTVSKINLVDLAGSERQVMAKTTGDRLRVSISSTYCLSTSVNSMLLSVVRLAVTHCKYDNTG